MDDRLLYADPVYPPSCACSLEGCQGTAIGCPFCPSCAWLGCEEACRKTKQKRLPAGEEWFLAARHLFGWRGFTWTQGKRLYDTITSGGMPGPYGWRHHDRFSSLQFNDLLRGQRLGGSLLKEGRDGGRGRYRFLAARPARPLYAR